MEALVKTIGNTDKHTVHSYIPVYEELFKNRLNAQVVAEIGVGDGGSIKLWEETFKTAQVVGLDISLQRNRLKFGERVYLFEKNAYQAPVANFLPALDILIDDGPHSLESMKQCLRLYLPKIKENGILIIEDVQDYAWIAILRDIVPAELQKCILIKDLRSVKNRYDDIMFIVDKSLL